MLPIFWTEFWPCYEPLTLCAISVTVVSYSSERDARVYNTTGGQVWIAPADDALITSHDDYSWRDLHFLTHSFSLICLTVKWPCSLRKNQQVQAYHSNSMKQTPSWEANRFSASQEISPILQNIKVHYYIHKSLPPVPGLSHINPAHAPFTLLADRF
jgi:hypothetical protein